MKFRVRAVLGATLAVAAAAAPAYWQNILSDTFSGDTASLWTAEGVSNAFGQALVWYDGGAGCVLAEWDQSNVFAGAGDPYVVQPSRLLRPLQGVLTDEDTFRFRVTLNLATGTVVDTTEMYQIANVGLYEPSLMGPDRAMSDNWSGNTTLVRDGSDFAEFNYFINNAWGGPNITAVLGAHIEGPDGDYITGTNWLQTAMGEGHWLPEGTNLYLEFEYFGEATGAVARCAHAGIYTDPARSEFLYVNGVEMSYWTQPMPEGKSFTLTHLGFYNYVAANWGGSNGAGRGTFDDAQVERWIPPGALFSNTPCAGGVALTWAAVSGRTYRVERATDLMGTAWSTSAVLGAGAETVTWTAALNGAGGYYRVVEE